MKTIAIKEELERIFCLLMERHQVIFIAFKNNRDWDEDLKKYLPPDHADQVFEKILNLSDSDFFDLVEFAEFMQEAQPEFPPFGTCLRELEIARKHRTHLKIGRKRLKIFLHELKQFGKECGGEEENKKKN